MLIHFHDAASAAQYLPFVRAAFRQAENPAAELIAVDWRGRQYVAIGDTVSWADLGFGEFAELAPLEEWREAVRDRPDEVLERELCDRFFAETSASEDGVAGTRCVELTVPMYLGGADDLANMAVIDLEVQWVLGSQLYAQIRDLPPGTPIGKITAS
jgi:hypothetical protein